MKFLILFCFGAFFGFFDFVWLMWFFLLGLMFLFLYGGGWFGGIFFMDGLSFFLFYLSILIFIFCFFSSFMENWSNNKSYLFFYVLSLIFVFLFFSFSLLSVFFFYVCFELIFMLMYFFVLGWGGSPERLQASFYMVFYTIVVSFPFLVYIMLFENDFTALKFSFGGVFSYYWGLFSLMVFIVKLPVYMTHLWLPKAHVEAPISGSMVLAGVLLKLGGYGFLRFSFFIPFFLFKYGGYLVSMGLAGGFFSCLLCLRQVDLKAFVAYSSVCHMGFALGGLYSYSWYGMAGSVYMLIAHGFCSSCLFYLLYIFYERFHTRSGLLLKGLGGMSPSVLLFWFAFSVLNMGVPPSFSFFSEISLVSGMLMGNYFVVFLVGMFLLFAGIYGIFFFVISCHGVLSLGGSLDSTKMREYLNGYGHFFPLVFIPFFTSFFF